MYTVQLQQWLDYHDIFLLLYYYWEYCSVWKIKILIRSPTWRYGCISIWYFNLRTFAWLWRFIDTKHWSNYLAHPCLCCLIFLYVNLGKWQETDINVKSVQLSNYQIFVRWTSITILLFVVAMHFVILLLFFHLFGTQHRVLSFYMIRYHNSDHDLHMVYLYNKHVESYLQRCCSQYYLIALCF